MTSKKEISLTDISKYIKDGDQVLVGGFGLSGCPLTIVDEIAKTDVKELTIVSNNLGEPQKGLGKLLDNGQIKKAIGSYFTTHRGAVNAWNEGWLEIELLPQGTMAEGIRAAGAGIPAFYTPTGAGTKLSENKEVREFDGKEYVLEKSIPGDVALIRAHKADEYGNLVYRKTQENFNTAMAMAGKIVIAEVDEIVPIGELKPEEIKTQHLFVDYLVKTRYEVEGGTFVERTK